MAGCPTAMRVSTLRRFKTGIMARRVVLTSKSPRLTTTSTSLTASAAATTAASPTRRPIPCIHGTGQGGLTASGCMPSVRRRGSPGKQAPPRSPRWRPHITPFPGGHMTNDRCSPGSHPHADRPNWRPAESYDEYLANCRDGLESYSERRVAKLFGMSRAALWRAELMAELPNELFEHILAEAKRQSVKLSEKALAQVALALRRGNNVAEVERCPHCGGVLRIRAHVSAKLADIVNQWLSKRIAVANNERAPTGTVHKQTS